MLGMLPDAVIQAVRDLVAEHHAPAGDDERLEMDSLTLVMLVEGLEDRFDIRISPRDLTPEHFATVRSLAALVEGKRS